MAAVIELAGYLGWRHYHTHDSRRSSAGFPDLVLVRGDRLMFVELKSERGKVSKEQDEWLDALRATGIEAKVYRPSEWAAIERRLR